MKEGDIMNKIEQADKKANRLINEKSPYLLQHAYNPVNWYAWGAEAFDKAKSIYLHTQPFFLMFRIKTSDWHK